MGDPSFEHVAGENIYNGIDGQTLLRLLEGSAHERELVAAAIERLSDQLRGHELMQERRDQADAQEREQRRDQLDESLAELRGLAAGQQREQRAVRRWLVILSIAVVVGFVAVAWIAYDRYTAATLLRLWIGSSLIVLAQLRKAP